MHLAARFGISGNGLAKICARLDVPCPPRGWWAKKAAGHKLEIPALTEAKLGTLLKVAISASPNADEGPRQAIAALRDDLGIIAVPERLTNPHPIIATWRERIRESQERARREHDPWRRRMLAVEALTDTERRRHRILHALFRTLEQRGATIKEDERRQLFATVDSEDMAFSLIEKSRQVKRPPSADERRWYSDPNKLITELQPTGMFEFTIRAWSEQPLRKVWRESDKHPVEAMLPEIVATFLVLAPLLAERRRKAAEQAKRWAEEARRREEERQRRKQDDNRWRHFAGLADRAAEVERARALLARLRELPKPADMTIDGRTVEEWLGWAEQQANARDPLARGVEELFAEIGRITAWSTPTA